jgi:hypothetical protein
MPNQCTKPNTLKLFDKLNRSREETTSSFFLKKNPKYGKSQNCFTRNMYPCTYVSKKSPFNISPQKGKNTEGVYAVIII